MKRKISVFSVMLLCILVATVFLSGCGEYRMPIDENLEPNIIDDNYRTFYEIFVGGFSDSNDDGMGDLQGVINRLDYLNDGDPKSGKSLGITGIWLMPVMFSFSYHKYDVIDYKTIDPDYGTMEDMRNLVAECHKRGINIIIDLVLNHTSKYHEWFKQAQQARATGDTANPYYDYYSVKIGNEGGGWYNFATDPNGNKWVYEGNFSSDMPELNYDNPAVKEAVEDIVRFWLSANLREKLHARKKTKPILKNSLGAIEIKGRRIQRFAPPAEVAILSGKNGISSISTNAEKKSKNPNFKKYFSGAICANNHIKKIPITALISSRSKK